MAEVGLVWVVAVAHRKLWYKTSASGRTQERQPDGEQVFIGSRYKNLSSPHRNVNFPTPVGGFMAGLPVAKLNSLGRVRVGFTTCITRYNNLLQNMFKLRKFSS